LGPGPDGKFPMDHTLVAIAAVLVTTRVDRWQLLHLFVRWYRWCVSWSGELSTQQRVAANPIYAFDIYSKQVELYTHTSNKIHHRHPIPRITHTRVTT
jgi:hypothetical protein